MRAYEMRHTVSFEETNVVGNVYFVSHLRWQGKCRELFLREHAPELLERLGRDLAMVTVSCSCEYLAELFAFDVVAVRMRLDTLAQARLSMRFEYWRVSDDGERLVGRGTQEVACMHRDRGQLRPAPWPRSFLEAMAAFNQPAPAGQS